VNVGSAGLLLLAAGFVGGGVLASLWPSDRGARVITLIGAILWLWVSVTPFLPFFQVVLQAVTVTIMLAGVVFSLAAVALSKKPRF